MHTRAHTPKQEPSLLRSQCGFVPSVKFFLFRHTFIYIHFPVLCEPHYISRGKNSGKVAAISFIPNRFSFRFSTSRTNGPRLPSLRKRVHTRLSEKNRTQALTRRNRGCFGWGWYHYPRRVPHVHEYPRAGCQNGVLCRFLALAGGAPKERREPSGQRCAYARRCSEGVAAPLGCVIFLQFGDVAVFSLCAQYFLNVQGWGGITTHARFARC